MKHLEHLEDLAFTHNGDELRVLASALIHHIYGGQDRLGNLSVKWDGAPAIVFGCEKDEERPFLSTKSYYNKTPIRYYSKEDIEASGKDPGLIEKLKFYWDQIYPHNLQYVWWNPGNVFHADVIADPFSKIEAGLFRPNIITYKIEGFQPDFDIAYHGGDYPFSGRPLHVYSVASSIVKKTDYSLLCHHLEYGCDFITHFEGSYLDVKESRKTVNRLIREGVDNPFTIADALGSDSNATKNWLRLWLLKGYLLKALNSRVQNHFVFPELQGIGEHEGFVFEYLDFKVKLINRPFFSRINLDEATPRGWTTNLNNK